MGLLGIQGVHVAPNLIHPLACFFALFLYSPLYKPIYLVGL